ncbi:hypothetical protein Scep_014704 [Stephania cephalantha]|uniref:Uncharacterized protein n=1 Tax=Stephania cephalantha TaxID=152367 RepID=A0AAP0P0M9_9MAGN
MVALLCFFFLFHEAFSHPLTSAIKEEKNSGVLIALCGLMDSNLGIAFVLLKSNGFD